MQSTVFILTLATIMKNTLLISLIFLCNLTFAQVLGESEEGLLSESRYYFPRQIDTLNNDLQVIYMIRHEKKSDSIFYAKDISKGLVVAKSVYINKKLSLVYENNQIVHFADRNCLGIQNFTENGVTESVHLDWGGYYNDSVGNLELVYYQSTKRIDGKLTECYDSLFVFYPNGLIRQKETYLDCENHGTWIYYDNNQNVIEKRFYSRGQLLKKEE